MGKCPDCEGETTTRDGTENCGCGWWAFRIAMPADPTTCEACEGSGVALPMLRVDDPAQSMCGVCRGNGAMPADPTTPAEREALRIAAESVATRGEWPFGRIGALYTDDLHYASTAAPRLILRLLSDLAAAEAQIAEARREGMEAGYDLGFADSGEGWNGEYPGDAQSKSHYATQKTAALRALAEAAEPEGGR